MPEDGAEICVARMSDWILVRTREMAVNGLHILHVTAGAARNKNDRVVLLGVQGI